MGTILIGLFGYFLGVNCDAGSAFTIFLTAVFILIGLTADIFLAIELFDR